MRGLVLVAVVAASCLPPPIVRGPDVITGPVGHTVPIFTTTHPQQCVELAEVETPIPGTTEGEAMAIKSLQSAALANGGDALLLLQAAEHPDHVLRGRALQCGL